VEQLAPHEKVYVDPQAILEDENHGDITCAECHGGNPADPDWVTAHDGVVKDPSFPDPSEVCGQCHEEESENFGTSLHANLAPYYKMIGARANPDGKVPAEVKGHMKNHCSACHSSCGQCHISRPTSVEGGLLDGHRFLKTPPQDTTCTACHGSRIQKEYYGKNPGIPPDVHRTKAYFRCEKCHSAEEMHGDGKDYANRYEVENGPKCLDCHKDIYGDKAENAEQHEIHQDLVSCQVCHSTPYKNCYSCHVGKDERGSYYFKAAGHPMDFKIGINPLQSDKRPETYVTVRHIPVDQGLFSFYERNALANFDALPTWKFATPHNIRRKTPQNESCNACHGNADLFLLEKDVKPEYLGANKNVIVSPDSIPEKIEE